MEIVGSIQTYAWGKLGLDSEVAKLAQLNSSDFHPDSNTPYAELWMGDHPSGQSKIKSTKEDLGPFIAKNSNLIGGLEKLPFLFKVLSVQKALSIQVHPNKKEAERLHSERPDIYKDPNHKPELAIALTPFLALCGFRSNDEIYKLVTTFKPLSDLLGHEVVDGLRNGSSGLKNAYVKLMTSNIEEVSECIDAISKNETELKDYGLKDIFERLRKDFPNDIGILSLFFFNLIKLKPGESIFLAANEPHAYLDGDCIECMACSDNVIRAGLTPKYKDVDSLLQMLNYNGDSPEKKLFSSIKKDNYFEIFVPNVKDFAVGKIHIPSGESYKLPVDKYGSIILVLGGKGILETTKYGQLNVQRGSVIFIPGDSGDYVHFSTVLDKSSEDFIAYIAMCNSF